MSSGFASVRCIRCGAYTQGVTQFCADCIERQRAEEAARAERVGQTIADRPAGPTPAAGGVCPSCGRYGNPGAKFCGYCRYQFRATAPGEGELVYAGFWIRFVAMIIDRVILFGAGIVTGIFVSDVWNVVLLETFLAAVYSIAFWVGQGATPGKMAVGIKVVMANAEPIEFGAACLRYVGYIACALTLGIGYLMIAFSAEKRGLHDNIAGTIVIKTR